MKQNPLIYYQCQTVNAKGKWLHIWMPQPPPSQTNFITSKCRYNIFDFVTPTSCTWYNCGRWTLEELYWIMCQWACFLVLISSQILSFLSWIDKSALGLAAVSIGLKPSYFVAISIRSSLYGKVFTGSKSFQEKSHITLYLFSECIKYSTISSVHWNFSLFSLSVSVSLSYSFFFLLGGSLKFWLSTKNFHVFSQHVVCYFLLLTRMCTCETITSTRQAISPGGFIWGERWDNPSGRYICYAINCLSKTIYRIGDIYIYISPVSYKQVGDVLLESAKTRNIVYASYIGWPIYRSPYKHPLSSDNLLTDYEQLKWMSQYILLTRGSGTK